MNSDSTSNSNVLSNNVHSPQPNNSTVPPLLASHQAAPMPQFILASGQLIQGIQGAQLLIPTSQGKKIFPRKPTRKNCTQVKGVSIISIAWFIKYLWNFNSPEANSKIYLWALNNRIIIITKLCWEILIQK